MTFTISPASPIDGEVILPLDDAKAHLRVLSNDEDTLIAVLRDAAIDWVERHCGVALSSRDFVMSGTGFDIAAPIDGTLLLPIVPVSAVSSISYLDASGVSQTLSGSGWRLASNMLALTAGSSWPATLRGPGAVTVTFTAGFADALAEAPALVAAVKLLLGQMFKFREEIVSGTIVQAVPLGVQRLCESYRSVRV